MSGVSKVNEHPKSPWGRVLDYLADFFFRLSIAKKLFVGYLFLVVLLVIISIYSLTTLSQLNALNRGNLETNMPVIESTDDMIDAILAQEHFIRNYVILKNPELLKAYWERGKEFQEVAGKVQSVPGAKKFPIDDIIDLQKGYSEFLIAKYASLEKPDSHAAGQFELEVKEKQDNIIHLIKGISHQAKEGQTDVMTQSSLIGTTAFKVAATLCVIGFLAAVAAAIYITLHISSAIKKLKYATERISEGDFDFDPQITNHDEVGDLSHAFISMAKRLKELEEISADASPLTRLPGGRAIENVMEKRIHAGGPIAFCIFDLDNFKAYNDHYGYAKGNDLILHTAKMINNAVLQHGGKDDFVGHIGGDDFVVITIPQNYENICKYVISEFDRSIPEFYNTQDRDRGFIECEDRHGIYRKFPFASISIAVVTNSSRTISCNVEYGEIASDLKDYAKSITGSAYIVDRRRNGEDGHSAEADVASESKDNVVNMPLKKKGKNKDKSND